MQKKIKDDAISRQAAIDHLRSIIDATDTKDRYNEGFADGLEFCISHVATMPAAQQEIIRCKDCKWSDWYDSTDGNRYCYCMETGASGRTADDFCSYAERRTDERRYP